LRIVLRGPRRKEGDGRDRLVRHKRMFASRVDPPFDSHVLISSS